MDSCWLEFQHLKFFRTVLIFWSLFVLQGCGAGSGKNPHSQDSVTQAAPYEVSITYIRNGKVETLSPPFLTTQSIFPDPATGACAGNAMEIIFNGSFDPEKVSTLSLTGLTSTANFSGSRFTFIACMAPGSYSATVTAYDKRNKVVPLQLVVSIHAITATKTLGFGSPRYPNTGFEIPGAASSGTPRTSGVHELSNVSMVSIGKKSTTSAGNAGYTMETGFVNYVHEVSP